MTETQRAAVQKALDVLFRAGEELRWQSIGQVERELRAALAERGHLRDATKMIGEPVAWGVMKRGERVWYVNDSRSVCEGYASLYAHRDANGFDQSVVPLYTAPPRREWVSLTDEEIVSLSDNVQFGSRMAKLARIIEAALKEKNRD